MNYAFITSESWRLEVKAKNPRQAFKKAQKEYENLQDKSEKGIFGFEHFFGKLTKSYMKFDTNGLSPIDRIYQLK